MYDSLDVMFSIIGFIIRNFIPFLGISLLVSCVVWILNTPEKDAILSMGSSFLLLFGTILHIFLYWKISTHEDKFFLVIAYCILPAIVALFIGSAVHDSCRDGCYIEEQLSVLGSYLIVYILARVFSKTLVTIIATGIGLVIAIAFFLDVSNQFTMDQAIKSNQLYTADSEKKELKELYKKGYRPSDYYQDAETHLKYKDRMRHFGINPDSKDGE